jgi:hypothetical protein
MRLVTALALAGGFVSAPLVTAGPAAALPCDGANCVPYVEHNINPSGSCVTDGNRFIFGLDASGRTYACTMQQRWTPQPPLVGVRMSRQPCGESKGVAQSPDGIYLSCIDGGWTADFTPFYF